MKKVIGITLVFGMAICAVPSYGHHSFAATFTNDTITVEGYVHEMKFTNPHTTILFDVTDDNGVVTRWVTEGGAPNGLRRRGWDKESVVQGDYIRVTGNSTRNGSPMVSTGELVFVNPNTGFVIGPPGGEAREEVVVMNMPLQLDNGLPNFTGEWVGDSTGRVGAPINNVPPLSFNEVGAALQAKFDAVNDPQVQCEPPGLARQAGFTPHPVRIAQYDDHVVISYEEYGGVRNVYFDDRGLVGGDHSHLGQSIAHYEGQKLIVESSHLLPNLVATNGNLLTDQQTIVETYYRNDDPDGRSVLALDMVVTDHGHLTAPWTISWGKYATSDYEFIGVDCQKPLDY